MPVKKIADFSLERLEILSPDGSVDAKLMPSLTKEQVLEMYRAMLLTRLFDKRAISLQRQGRIGTYGSSLGQEASVIGPACALRKADWLVPSFREAGAMLFRGIPLHEMFQYWRGEERGHKYLTELRVMPVAIPVSTQTLHATGLAWAMKMKGEKAIALTYFGDGATSTGDLYEAMNFAGVFKLPVVFWCQNNQFAISVPVSRQTAAKSLAQKAIAAGIRGVQVDGNDIFATYAAAKQAVADALEGRPTMVESHTYRMADHTTSDDASRYRSPEETQAWQLKDPLDRLEKYMRSKGMLNDSLKEKVLAEETARIQEAVQRLEECQVKPKVIFTHTYASLDPDLKEQLDAFQRTYGLRGGD